MRPAGALHHLFVRSSWVSSHNTHNAIGETVTLPELGFLYYYYHPRAQLFQVDDFMWSLIVSLYALGGAFGGAAGGPAAGALGYKKAMLVDNIFWIAAGLLQALAPPGSAAGPYMLIAGRLLCGFAAGFACACVPPYIIDIAPDAYRGVMGIMHQLFVVLGVLIATILGMQAILGNASLWWLGWGIYVLPAAINFGMQH